jgi:ABC-type multidrug transport system fused ATPase/permease subunit
MSRFTTAIANRYNKIISHKPKSKEKQAKRKKFKEIDDNLNNSLEEQGAKMMNPLKNLADKSKKSSVLFIITNSATIILGIVLLVYPGASMMIWGLIFLYTGFSNLLNGMHSMHLSKMLKEKRFKEILFEAEKKPNKTSEKPKAKQPPKTKKK